MEVKLSTHRWHDFTYRKPKNKKIELIKVTEHEDQYTKVLYFCALE